MEPEPEPEPELEPEHELQPADLVRGVATALKSRLPNTPSGPARDALSEQLDGWLGTMKLIIYGHLLRNQQKI